jgi:hypothetical protein
MPLSNMVIVSHLGTLAVNQASQTLHACKVIC